jgi:hypothetical protein
VERLLPKRQHLVEVDAIDDNGADLQFSLFVQFTSHASLSHFLLPIKIAQIP